MAVLLIVAVVFVAALALFLSVNARKRGNLEGTAAVVGEFAARNGWRFGRFEPNLPARAPHVNELVGGLELLLDFQVDGAMHDVAFQAFQVRRRPPRRTVSTYTPEYVVVLVPRPVPGPELQLAPRGVSWATAFRRDIPVGDPAFDAAFHVSSDVPAFAAHLLRPPLTTWLASDARVQHAVVVFERNDLMAVVRGPLSPDSVTAFAGLMTELHRRIPWNDLAR
jgi:hypothetical protein